MTRTRLLGVDHGNVRVGLAVCDPDRTLASPLETYTRKSPNQDAAFFSRMCQQESIVGIVVGLPVHMSGDEGEKAKLARAFGRQLAEWTGLPVAFWDERFSSGVAAQALRSAGVGKKGQKGRIDRVAAQVILAGFLEAGCPADAAPGPLA